ncbi:hypothetical protein S245_019871, partial [Arachis hypogaea]
MHEMVPGGKRLDRYHDLRQEAFRKKLGLWIVVPQQLLVEVGIYIIYMVIGGNCDVSDILVHHLGLPSRKGLDQTEQRGVENPSNNAFNGYFMNLSSRSCLQYQNTRTNHGDQGIKARKRTCLQYQNTRTNHGGQVVESENTCINHDDQVVKSRVPPFRILLVEVDTCIVYMITREDVEMYEIVQGGKRLDRYDDLRQEEFGKKFGLWILVLQQLLVEVGTYIIYMVIGGKSLKK